MGESAFKCEVFLMANGTFPNIEPPPPQGFIRPVEFDGMTKPFTKFTYIASDRLIYAESTLGKIHRVSIVYLSIFTTQEYTSGPPPRGLSYAFPCTDEVLKLQKSSFEIVSCTSVNEKLKPQFTREFFGFTGIADALHERHSAENCGNGSLEVDRGRCTAHLKNLVTRDVKETVQGAHRKASLYFELSTPLEVVAVSHYEAIHDHGLSQINLHPRILRRCEVFQDKPGQTRKRIDVFVFGDRETTVGDSGTRDDSLW